MPGNQGNHYTVALVSSFHKQSDDRGKRNRGKRKSRVLKERNDEGELEFWNCSAMSRKSAPSGSEKSAISPDRHT
jgi:hypothetical protein